MFGQWLANVWQMFGQCLANGWPMIGQCLADVWPMYGQCLANVWPMLGRCLANIWPMAGQCLANARRACYKPPIPSCPWGRTDRSTPALGQNRPFYPRSGAEPAVLPPLRLLCVGPFPHAPDFGNKKLTRKSFSVLKSKN